MNQSVKISQEKSEHQKKLSRPSHGPYHVTSKKDPDITVVKVHFPDKGAIQAPVTLTGMEDLANIGEWDGEKMLMTRTTYSRVM